MGGAVSKNVGRGQSQAAPGKNAGQASVGPAQPKRILFYTRGQPYYEFTNFSEHTVTVGEHTYKTSEAAYQAQKFPKNLHELFYDLGGREAFDLAKEMKVGVRSDWHSISLRAMNAIVALKIAQHPKVKKLLLETGQAELVEDSPRDSFFGCGSDGQGRNELGKIWMAQRARLRAEQRGDTVEDICVLLKVT